MGDTVRTWIMTLAGTAAFAAVAQALSPEGMAKRAVRLACGLGILAALLSLGIDFRWEAYALSLSEYRSMGEQYTQEGENLAMENTRAYIETQCAAYISSKAETLGGTLTADVTARWSGEGYWYPYSVTVFGEIGAEERNALSAAVEAELGIPAERQVWEEQNG